MLTTKQTQTLQNYTRAKDNMLFEVVSEAEVDKSTGIISDERIKYVRRCGLCLSVPDSV